MNDEAIDATDWAGYLVAENQLFDEVKTNITQHIESDQKNLLNRYYDGSLVYPDHFENNWSHSYILQPEGNSKGAVVLLHELTDTPYSLRMLPTCIANAVLSSLPSVCLHMVQCQAHYPKYIDETGWLQRD